MLESQLQEFYHRYDPERVLHVRHDLEQYSLPELCQMFLITYREVPLGWRSYLQMDGMVSRDGLDDWFNWNTDWREKQDPTGHSFWLNTVTQEIRWYNPMVVKEMKHKKMLTEDFGARLAVDRHTVEERLVDYQHKATAAHAQLVASPGILQLYFLIDCHGDRYIHPDLLRNVNIMTAWDNLSSPEAGTLSTLFNASDGAKRLSANLRLASNKVWAPTSKGFEVGHFQLERRAVTNDMKLSIRDYTDPKHFGVFELANPTNGPYF